MRVPGRAWLEFEATEEDGVSTVRQTAIFDPVGLFRIAYWYALYPLHHFVFGGMLRNIVRSIKASKGTLGSDDVKTIEMVTADALANKY